MEAQHIAATTKLVDSMDEQRVLEGVLDETKAPIPAGAESLDYLLWTPFRYRAPAGGSRFRAETDPGVFYAADEIRTACAELGYWRWRFLMDTEAFDSFGPVAHTVFQMRGRGRAVDLRDKPFLRDHKKWIARDDYGATQAFGAAARAADIALIRYESVRDPESGGCVAVLRLEAFSPAKPLTRQTWFLTVNRASTIWRRDDGGFDFVWA